MPIKNVQCIPDSRQHAAVSRRSASRTHTAQEIKAVNKGRSDKESPDSYESGAAAAAAASSFTTRVDGHEKTNHGNERRGHHLHVALPIHTHFYLARMSAAYLTDHCLCRSLSLSPRPPPLPPFGSPTAATESDRCWEEILFEFINLL